MQQQQYNSAFIFSLLLHGIVLLVLIVSFEFNSQVPVVDNSDANAKIINAVAVDMPRQQPIISRPSSPPPQIKPSPSLAAQQAQKQRVLEIRRQRAIAINEQRIKRQKAILADQLLADLKKQTVKKNVQSKQKAIEQAMEKELQEQAAKTLQQQMQSEAMRAAASAKRHGEVNKYKALILQAIGQRWLVPTGIDKKLYSELLIRLAPGGIVLDVQVTKSSGDLALDRSARDAVLKASPLPVPSDSDAFDEFRQFVLKARPENVTMSDFG